MWQAIITGYRYWLATRVSIPVSLHVRKLSSGFYSPGISIQTEHFLDFSSKKKKKKRIDTSWQNFKKELFEWDQGKGGLILKDKINIKTCIFGPNKDLSRDMTKPTKWVCAQRRPRSALASAKSDQSLRCLHEESLGP